LEAIDELKDQPEIMCRGGSVVVSPMGDVLAGPVYDKEAILYADLDLDEIVRAQLDLDVVGHYARPDVFQLYVNEKPLKPVNYNPK
jgi:nitrilase